MPNLKKNHILSFALVTLCFVLWGVANEMTTLIEPVFARIFMLGKVDTMMAQFSFYGGYFLMAVPASIYIWSRSFKSGIMVGLALYAIGAFLFYPASQSGDYILFCAANFVVACGLSFLETSANPYILTLGTERNASFRLNLAQSFNSIGWLGGLFVVNELILKHIFAFSASQRAHLDPISFRQVREADLQLISTSYLWLGVAVAILGVVVALVRIHEEHDMKPTYYYDDEDEEGMDGQNYLSIFKGLLANRRYRFGIITQFVYVGTQILAWFYIVEFAKDIFVTTEGYSQQQAELTAGHLLIFAFALFGIFRFVMSFLMKLIRPAILLAFTSAIAVLLVSASYVFYQESMVWLMVAIGGCMSLMFPTIYSLSMKDMDIETVKVAAAGQIMAILGGSVIPFAVRYLSSDNVMGGLSLVPCFAFILFYAIWIIKEDKKW